MTNEITVQIPKFKTPIILVLFEDGTEIELPVLSKVRGISLNGKRPIGFYYEPNQPTYGIDREKFLTWIHEEFKYIFDKKAFTTYLPLLKYS